MDNEEDVGELSNVSANKGRASDAFKRAATNWGIGRELYSSPQNSAHTKKIWNVYQQSNEKCSLNNDVSFFVSEIEYDEAKRIIKALVIKDGSGNYRFAYPDAKRNEIQKRIEAAQQVGALVAASVEKGKEKPLPEIILLSGNGQKKHRQLLSPKIRRHLKMMTHGICVSCAVSA